MATTTINRSEPIGRMGSRNIPVVALAILAALAVLLGITLLVYRDAPRIGVPGQIDQAEGVAPQYPPAAPAYPPSREAP